MSRRTIGYREGKRVEMINKRQNLGLKGRTL